LPWLVAVSLGCAGCSSPDEPPEPPPDPEECDPPDSEECDPPDPVEPSVEIGLPPPEDDLGFAALEPGGEILIQSFGQGGTHALLAIRCIGFGNRAYVTVTITNLNTNNEVFSPTPARPQLLLCRDDDTCDLVPLLVMLGGLAAPDEERDGLPVMVSAEVHNDAGLEASGSQFGVLSTDAL
jgi:hypothetical protein